METTGYSQPVAAPANQLATMNGASHEIIEAEVVPQFGITLEEAGRRLAEMRTFVQQQMKEGEDYGIIPGTKKPSLWKAGAEKLNMMFGLSPQIEILDKVVCYGNVEGQRPFFAYEIKVALINKRDGRIEAEGVGSANSGEKKYKTQSAFDVANTVFKIAKKRALVDATLSATRASGIFTQDKEDFVADRSNGAAGYRQPQQAQAQQAQARQNQRPQQQQRPQQPRAQQPKYELLGDLRGAKLDWLIECRDWIFADVPTHPQRQEVIDEIARQQEENQARLDAQSHSQASNGNAPNRARDVARGEGGNRRGRAGR